MDPEPSLHIVAVVMIIFCAAPGLLSLEMTHGVAHIPGGMAPGDVSPPLQDGPPLEMCEQDYPAPRPPLPLANEETRVFCEAAERENLCIEHESGAQDLTKSERDVALDKLYAKLKAARVECFISMRGREVRTFNAENARDSDSAAASSRRPHSAAGMATTLGFSVAFYAWRTARVLLER